MPQHWLFLPHGLPVLGRQPGGQTLLRTPKRALRTVGEYVDTRGHYHPTVLRSAVQVSPKDPHVPHPLQQLVFRKTHPNIIPILDAVQGDTADFLYVFTPFCDHGTLSDVLRNPALSIEALHSILADVCEGLYHLNMRMKMLHRNINSGSIFVRSGDHGPVGLIGDVDGILLRDARVREQHDDPRRDQAALLGLIEEAVAERPGSHPTAVRPASDTDWMYEDVHNTLIRWLRPRTPQ